MALATMIELYQVGIFVIIAINQGRFVPVVLIPGVAVLPGIGFYSGVSAGGLIPPLVFILTAIMIPRRRSPHRR